MDDVNAYDVYAIYFPLRMHFSSSYDYFKYQGRVKSIQDKVAFINSNKQKYFFFRVMKLHTTVEDIKIGFIANFLENEKFFISNYDHKLFIDLKKKWSDLYGHFRENLKFLNKVGNITGFKNYILSSEFIKDVIAGDISLETVIMLDKVFHFLPKLAEDPLWELELKRKVEKYYNFLEVRDDQCKLIVKQFFDNLKKDF